MKVRLLLTFVCVVLCSPYLKSQTSWKGTTNTSWNTSSNWTAGVPSSTVDAIIGDSSFTGSYQPLLGSTSSCKNLTIGAGTVSSTLTIGKSLNVSGNITIGSNGTILANTNNRTITVKGNWTNNGTYSATRPSAKVTFSGTSQTLTGVTAFQSLTINSGSTLTLANNISVANSFTVSGTLDPSSYTVSGSGNMTVNSTGTLMVQAANYSGNYTISGTVTLNASSTVNYASASTAQNISSSLTYGKLRISGGSAKSLTANLPGLNSSIGSAGNIYVDAGTLDLKTFTANRSSSGGGSITLAAGTTLRIGGTNTFPSNYLTHSIAPGSTVEYYGNNQTVTATTYGNLTLSGTSGSVTKTMPGTAFTIAGHFTSSLGTATSLSYTAAQNITVNKDIIIGTSCTFNGGSYTHTLYGNWANSGTFTGSTSTIVFNGINANLSGTGTHNFNNLSITAYGVTATSTAAISVGGNISTTTPGIFTHASGGTLTMTGSGKTITGNGFEFYNLAITGTISTTANIRISNNLTNNGTFSGSAGTITMSGSSGAINGSNASTLYSLSIVGTVTTAANFNMLYNLSVASSASFTATGGTATMNGTSTLSGTANLYNVTINSSKTLLLGSGSILGVAGTLTRTGTLDVTSVTPNTVNFNGSGAQSIVGGTYHNLVLSTGGTKTPSSAVTVNNDFTIQSGVTFNASSFVFSLYRHWNNLGTFTASTSDVQLRGGNAATITGASTFNTLTVNKSSQSVKVTLANNTTAANIVMTNGNMATGTNSITTTGDRTGNGIIIGTVIHNHSFANATAYAFEGPNNLITFTNPSGITSVSVTTKIGEIADFDPALESVTREYQVAVTSGTYTSATLRVHYENNELNAFAEPFLSIYKHNSGTTWDSLGYTSRDTSANYVELSGITVLAGRYSESGIRNIIRWNGSVSSAWNDAANWTTISGASMANRVPTNTDAAQIGEGAFTNNPTITTTEAVSVLRFGDAQAAILTINGGALTSSGSIRGQWSTSRSHILDVSSGTLTSETNLLLSDDSTGHDIHLKIGSGNVHVRNHLIHSGTGAVTFTGTGNLYIHGDYDYYAGSFTPGSGTVTFSGGDAQHVPHLTYNNLLFAKTTERASLHGSIIVNGNFSTSMGGEVAIFDSITIAGNITIGSSTYLYNEGARIKVAGNWQSNGNYISNNGTVVFNGSANQTVNASTFTNLQVNKSSGSLVLVSDLVVNGDLTVSSGTLDLDTFRANRFTEGGVFTMGSGGILKVKGASNFPVNYISNTLHATSTVEYYGTATQNIASPITYGNLTISNGGSNAKTLSGDIQINGNFLLNPGAAFNAGTHSINLYGNFTNSGTFSAGTSSVTLNGASKTITGATTFNNLSVVAGSYTVSSGAITITGNLYVESTGVFNLGTNNASLDGDLTNKGSIITNGTATFTGTRVQTIQLLNAITSSFSGIINFNGTVAPEIHSNTAPAFATVNINNTGGITPSVPWTVYVSFNVASGATFNAGPLTHTFYGNFTNNGTITSTGKLKFNPGAPFSASATIRLDGTSFISTGEIEFAGTAPITILQVNPSLNIVNITNTHSSGVTAPGSWTITDELQIGTGAIFNAGSSTSHLISGSVTNNGTLEGQSSTIRFNGAAAEINGLGTYNFNHLKAESTAELTLNRRINLYGNLIIDGIFTVGDRAVTFAGTSASTISGTAGSVTFDDLVQAKTGANTTLSVPVTVTGELDMQSGNIITTSTNILNIADNGTATSGSSSSFVSGPVKKTGDDAFVFPVGKGTTWARLGISAPSAVTDEFVAEYFNTPYSNTTSMAGSPSPALNDVSVVEYWTCNRTAGTSSALVTLYWENTQSGINDYSSDLVVARWNGSAWENRGQSAITASTPGNVTSNSISSFSPFTFGSLSASLNLLPIRLVDFDAKLNTSGKVDISWKTAQEINNDYFIVERSQDGLNFTPVAKVDGAGNSNSLLSYKAADHQPYRGISYYRLKQTDFDGHSEYSHKVAIVNDGQDANDVTVYPNPATGDISVRTGMNAAGTIRIHDIHGSEVYTGESDGSDMHLDISGFEKGIYIITYETASGSMQYRFTKI